jgi:hypothetical protein
VWGVLGVGGTRAEKGREKQRGEGKGCSPLACLSTSNPQRERAWEKKPKGKKEGGETFEEKVVLINTGGRSCFLLLFTPSLLERRKGSFLCVC